MRNPFHLFKGCVALAVSLLATVVTADVLTYIGADGGDWYTPENWDAGRSPGLNDDVVVNGKWVKSSQSVKAKSIQQTGGAITIGGSLQDITKQQTGDAVSTEAVVLQVAEGVTIDGGSFSLGGRDQKAHVSASIGGDFILTNSAQMAVYAGPATADFTDREVAAKALYDQADAFAIGGEFYVGPGSVVYPENDWITGTPVIFKPVDFTLAKGGTVDTRKRGWGWKSLVGELPPGARQNKEHYTFAFGAGDSYNRGGGYGGFGGAHTATIGCTYGNANAPFLPGSPNGLYAESVPRGNGSICVLASGHATIDGALLASGQTGNSYGAPSGGGVWIAARTFRVSHDAIIDIFGESISTMYESGGGGGRAAFAAGLTAEELDAVAHGEEPASLSFSPYALGVVTLEGGIESSSSKRADGGTCVIVHNPAVSIPVDITAVPNEFGAVEPAFGSYALDATALPVFSSPTELSPDFYLGTRHYTSGGYIVSNLTGVAESVSPAETDPLTLIWKWEDEKNFVRLVVSGNGTIRCNGTDYAETTDLWIPTGTELSLTATAGEGATFLKWAGDFPGVVSDSPSLVVTNQARMMITADFGGTGVAKSYIGPDGGLWHAGANWKPEGIPTLGDAVTLPAVFVKAYGVVQAASLTQAAGGSLAIGGATSDAANQTPPNDYALPYSGLAVNGDVTSSGAISLGSRHQTVPVYGFAVGGDLELDGSAVLALYAPDLDGEITFDRLCENPLVASIGGALRIEGQSVLYPENSVWTGTSVKFEVGGDVHVAEQSKIDADKRGWGWIKYELGEVDPRALSVGNMQFTLAPGHGEDWRIGGGYGGGNDAPPQMKYGYRYAPFLPGSPAGNYGTYLDACRGGGAIWIQTPGTISLDGQITTTGGRGWSTSSSGTGGGVWLIAGKFTAGPAASIFAEGCPRGSGFNSGGAGGRVSIALGLSDEQADVLAHGGQPPELSYSDEITAVPVSVLGGLGLKDGTTGIDNRSPEGTVSTVLGEVREIPLVIRSVPDGIESEPVDYSPHIVEKGVPAAFEATQYGYAPGSGKKVRYACAGYIVSNQTEEVASGKTTRVEFTPERGPLTLTWLWNARETTTVVNVGEGGTVRIGDEVLSGGDHSFWTAEDQTLTFSAAAGPGHEFLYWNGDVPLGMAPLAEISVSASKPFAITPVFRVREEPMPRTWVGGNKRFWLDPQGWKPAGNIPGLHDDVVITNGFCFASNYVEVASLTLGGNARLRIASTVEPVNIDSDIFLHDKSYYESLLGEAALVVHDKLSVTDHGQLGVGAIGQRYRSRVSVEGDLALSGEAVMLVAGGELGGDFTHATGSGSVDVSGELAVEGTSAFHVVSEGYTGGSVVFHVGRFHLAPEATIYADGYGYQHFTDRNPVALAPGYGISYHIGASHGGEGNNCAFPVYDFPNSPVEPGSPNGAYQPPYRGGGVIRIHSSGTIHAEGAFLADGYPKSWFGGPSGGSIWLTANHLHIAPTAEFRVKGGPAYNNYRSQGGGGRIALGLCLSPEQIKSLSETGECPANGSLRILDLPAFLQRYPGVTVDLSPGDILADHNVRRPYTEEKAFGTFRFLDATQPAMMLMLR